MKKLLLIPVVLLVILILAVVAIFFYVDAVAKSAIERGSTYALGVETSLDSADVGIFTGEFSMSSLNVANPDGYDTEHFLTLKDGGVAVSLKTLRGHTVELPYLRLSDIDINLEKKTSKANYEVIFENLKRFESDGAPKPPDPDAKRFTAREILIENILVHINLLPIGGELTKLKVPIAEIRLEDVGTETDRGLLMRELANVVVKALLEAIADKGQGILPAELLGELRNGLAQLEDLESMGVELAVGAIGNVTDELGARIDEELGKVIGDNLPDGLKDIGDSLGDDVGEGIKKGLGGLLGGDDNDKKDD